MVELATGRKLRARLTSANALAVRVGRSAKALSIPLAPSASQAEEISAALGRFEKFLQTSKEGERNRERKLRGF